MKWDFIKWITSISELKPGKCIFKVPAIDSKKKKKKTLKLHGVENYSVIDELISKTCNRMQIRVIYKHHIKYGLN